MESLLQEIITLLIAIGPWVVFAVAAVETAAFVGLVIPAEATVLVAAFMADRGYFALGEIVAATLCGGAVGDQAGYLLGRHGGTRIVARGHRLGRLWSRYEASTTDLFRRHAALSVTLARFLSFIRTLMPWFAGMSRMPYPRFLVFDLLGVLGWGLGSIALGYLAGESWDRVASALGTAGGVAVALLVAVALVLLRRRRRRAGAAPAAAGAVPVHATPPDHGGSPSSGAADPGA
ncbi:MAG TPA: DedA family protein [Longimicrobiales bacterium]